MAKSQKDKETISGFKSAGSKLGPPKSKSKSHHSSRRSKRSARSRGVERTQRSKSFDGESGIKSDKTQKSLSHSNRTDATQTSKTAPPDNDKFDDLKKDAIQVRKTQILTKEKQAKELKPKSKVGATSPNTSEFVFDKTQWELTKWAEDAKKNDDILPTKPLNGADVAVKSSLAPPKTAIATEIPGENRQGAGEQGDYLNDLPTVSIVLNGIEMGIALLALLLSFIASHFKVFGVYVTFLNLLLGIGAAAFTLVWHIRRGEIGEEETAQKTKRYFVKAFYKKLYFNLCYWRTVGYFCCFVIFMYYGTCGDQVFFRTFGYCKTPSYAGALYIIDSLLCLLAMAPPIMHLVYMKRKVFAITYLCGAPS